MAVNAVKPGCAGIRVASLNGLSAARASSRCSSWVARLDVRKPALKALTFSRCSNFTGEKLTRQKWQSVRHVKRLGGARASDTPDSLESSRWIPLEAGTFEGEDFKAAQRAYTEHANIVRNFAPCELSAEFEAQKVLRLAHEPFWGVQEKTFPLWHFLQRAQGILAAAVLTVVMLINVPQPSKPAMREPALTSRSVGAKEKTARTHRRRQPKGQLPREEAGSGSFILPAVLSCAVIAMLAQLLRKKATLEMSKPEPEPEPQVTVFNLHVGVLGTATSLRMDLDEIEEEKDNSHLSHISRMSRTGMRKALSGTARVLMKNLEHIAYASNTANRLSSSGSLDTIITNWQRESSFHARTGEAMETLQSVALEYGRKVQERLTVDSLKAGYTVINLSCAIKKPLLLPIIEDTMDLHVLLAQLEKVESEDILVMNLKWTPKKGELLPEETMLKFYPSLKLLATKEDLEDYGVLTSSEAVTVDA